jgi:hydroxymethylbilane synthase
VSLRLGTRGSALALAQARAVADAVRATGGRGVELVEIVTAGDRSSAPVQRLGQGVFVSALRDALLAKEIDFAVHSYKDLPSAPADGLAVAAVPRRADPRDALVARDGRTLAELPPGSRVGTGAVRRIAQLHALGMGLEVVPIRGNVDTRLGRVRAGREGGRAPDGELDAVVLASAGLVRLGRLGEATELLDPALMLPAPAQGALAVECRTEDAELVGILSGLDHAPTRAAVTAERALLAALEAGCSAPVAALATVAGDQGGWVAGGDRADRVAGGGHGEELYLRGAVISPDGGQSVRLSRAGTLAGAWEVGLALAADLLAAGADTILGDVPK